MKETFYLTYLLYMSQILNPKLVISLGNHQHYIFHPENDIHIVIDRKANVVPVLEYTDNLGVWHNGNTEVVIAMDYRNKTLIYSPPGVTNFARFQHYIAEIKPQRNYINFLETAGKFFDFSTVTDEITSAMNEIMAPLSNEYKSKCTNIPTAFHICKTIGSALKNTLRGLNQVSGPVNTPFRGDFKWLVGLFLGMSELFSFMDEGLFSLAQKDITLDLPRILNEQSGVDVFIYLFREMKPHFDLLTIYEPVLNSPRLFFNQIAQLSGNVNYGFDGFLNLVSTVYEKLEDKNSEIDVRGALIAYCSNAFSGGEMMRKQWEESAEKLLTLFEDLGLEKTASTVTLLANNANDKKPLELSGLVDGNVLDAILQLQAPCDAKDVDALLLKLFQQQYSNTIAKVYVL